MFFGLLYAGDGDATRDGRDGLFASEFMASSSSNLDF